MTGAFAIQRPAGANAICCHSASVTSECHFAAPTLNSQLFRLFAKFSVFRFPFSVFCCIFALADVEGFGLIATTIKKC